MTPSSQYSAGTPPEVCADAANLPVIDLVQFEQCCTGEPDLDLELLQMAMTVAEESVEKMTLLLDATDGEEWGAVCHRARGSCGTMGFARVAGILHFAEHDAADRDTRAAVLRKLVPELRIVHQELGARGFVLPAPRLPERW